MSDFDFAWEKREDRELAKTFKERRKEVNFSSASLRGVALMAQHTHTEEKENISAKNATDSFAFPPLFPLPLTSEYLFHSITVDPTYIYSTVLPRTLMFLIVTQEGKVCFILYYTVSLAYLEEYLISGDVTVGAVTSLHHYPFPPFSSDRSNSPSSHGRWRKTFFHSTEGKVKNFRKSPGYAPSSFIMYTAV